MLRARAWDRSGPYVCNLCRRKLSRPVPSSTCSNSLSSHSAFAIDALVVVSTTPGACLLSTTRLLRNDGQPQKPDASGPAGKFGGFGGFGGGGGPKLGAFSAKKITTPPPIIQAPPPQEETTASPAASTSTPAPAFSPQTAKPMTAHKAYRKAQHEHAQRTAAPDHGTHANKSRLMLHGIFKSQTDRASTTSNSSTLSATSEASTSAVTESASAPPTTERMFSEVKKAPAWGIFSQRSTTVEVQTPKPAQTQTQPRTQAQNEPPKAAPTRFTGFGAFSSRKAEIDVSPPTSTTSSDIAPATKSFAQRERRTEQSAWAKTTTARREGLAARATTGKTFEDMAKMRQDASSPGKQIKDDFWGELEERVVGYQDKIKSAPKKTPEPISATEWIPERETPSQPQKKARKSRFEEEDEWNERQAKKSEKNSKNRRSQSDDWEDDPHGYQWEEAERKQEEKRLRKLEEEQAAVAIPIFLPEFISVGKLAQSLKLKAENFLYDLEEMGFENMTTDTLLTGDTAALIAMEYGYEPTVDTGSTRDLQPRPAPAPEDVHTLPSRPPIVTIMGHVDHGKTTLLDYLRKSSVAAQEHGGITQHIGAFIVKMSSGKPITFLDTPGHAAFLTMRQRGANVTDIVVLVVAADDSVKPQTLEALKHAQTAKVPIIVAINKIDKEEARVDQVKADLARHGVQIEDYGGDVQVVEVSGKTGQGMDDLEENIVTLAEILDVRSEHDGMAEGWVLESSVKPDGKVATVLVKRGTLRQGDIITAGKSWARIRLLRNEAGAEVTEAPPGTPVEILGWRDLPEAGERVLQAPDEDKAKTAIDYRLEMAERQQSSLYIAEQEQKQREKEAAEAAAAAAEKEGREVEEPTMPGIIYQKYTVKADVAGSVEAVCGTIQELGNNEVQSKILRSGVGQISESDIDHASISEATIVNFNLPIAPHIKRRAEEAGVRIVDHSVIYHVVDDVKAGLEALLPPKIIHRVIAEADVLQIFNINLKKRLFKNIAGCKVRNGTIKRNSLVKVLRKGRIVYEGSMDTLKHVKKDVTEMGKGTECGIGLENFEDLQENDQIQTYEVIQEKRSL